MYLSICLIIVRKSIKQHRLYKKWLSKLAQLRPEPVGVIARRSHRIHHTMVAIKGSKLIVPPVAGCQLQRRSSITTLYVYGCTSSLQNLGIIDVFFDLIHDEPLLEKWAPFKTVVGPDGVGWY